MNPEDGYFDYETRFLHAPADFVPTSVPRKYAAEMVDAIGPSLLAYIVATARESARAVVSKNLNTLRREVGVPLEFPSNARVGHTAKGTNADGNECACAYAPELREISGKCLTTPATT